MRSLGHVTPERGPAPLLPVPTARLVGFGLLAALAAVQWTRMAEGLGSGRAMVWVLAALGGAWLVVAAQRLPERSRGWATIAATVAALAAAVLVSGLELALLKPARWGELGEGLLRGAEALGGVRLPYEGRDPWPREALELSGALLCTLSALVAVWPRGRVTGYPFIALAALLTLVATPVVSIGGPEPLMLGAALAVLSGCFLWLERLPVRPGAGVAVLAGLALAGALPLGAAADRDEPWFDYRSWAEALGPLDPVRYDWDHEYGPIQLPREGVELFRSDATRPFYWKAANLADFDGHRWIETSRTSEQAADPQFDLPFDFGEREDWNHEFSVSLRRLRSETVVAAGTILDVPESSRPVEPDPVRGDRWEPVRATDLGRGDSYRVRVHVPAPTPEELSAATVGGDARREPELKLRVDFRKELLYADPTAPRTPPTQFDPAGVALERAELSFPPFASEDRPTAHYTDADITADGIRAIRRTGYLRSYRLAQRLKRGAVTPYEFVLRVNAHLRRDPFRYTESPPETAGEPLDDFLNETYRGYCQQFSGAMALILRMGGVPARVAAGFSPGGFRRKRGEWIVRDTDAHSWVEVWFDGIGWVTFDPTPPGTPARSQVAAITPVDDEEEAEEEATPDPADPAARRPEGLQRETATASGDDEDGGTPWLAIGGGGGGGLALGLLALVLVRRRRRRRPAPEPAAAADLALAELQRALRRAGRQAPVGVTLTGLEGRLGASGDGAGYLRALRAARFAPVPKAPTREQRAAFRRDLAAGLGWRGRVRALWALPPRLRD